MVGRGDVVERRPAAPIGAPLGRVVELGDVVGEPVHQSGVELAGLRQRVKQQRLIEAPHRHDPVDLRSLIAEAHQARRIAAEPADFEIEHGRGAPVQRQLGRAGLTAAPGGGKIEIGQLDRALQLVGPLAGQKNQRHMGFDNFDPLDRRPVGICAAEKGNRLALIVANWGSQTPSCRCLWGMGAGSMVIHVALSALKGGEGGDPSRSDGEGEVGGRATRLVGPPHPTLSPRPAGGEGKRWFSVRHLSSRLDLRIQNRFPCSGRGGARRTGRRGVRPAMAPTLPS